MIKKILHVLSSNDIAGAENVAMVIINNLSDTYICSYASPEGGIVETLQDRGIHYIPMKKFSILQIRKIVKEWKPDIIHAHDFKATIKCLLASVTIPVISHIHQNPSWLKGVNLYSTLFFLACFYIKNIIVVSPVIKESTMLSSHFNKKTIVVKNIVDISWILKKVENKMDKPYDLAFIGRFEDVKDPLRFIKIVSEVVQEFPRVKVVMVGGGSMEEACKQAIDAYKLHQTIDIRGFVTNPYPILKNCKVFVMTSKSEGLPMVVMEALALGKPVLVPKLAGIESIVDHTCGFICEEDKDFISSIRFLLKSEEYYLKMSLAARNKAEQVCNMDKYKEQLIKVYSSVI